MILYLNLFLHIETYKFSQKKDRGLIMILNYTVKNFMATKLITFLPQTPIEVAIGTFLKNKISGAPVINEKNELIGVISEKDCMKTLMEYSYHNDFIRYYLFMIKLMCVLMHKDVPQSG